MPTDPRAGPVVPVEQRIRVLLVEDHAVVREGLEAVLERTGRITIAAQAGSVGQALDVLEREPVHMVMLDLRLGDEHGTDFLRAVRERGDDVPVLVLSAHETTVELDRALAAGATGYVLKGSDATTLARAVLDTAAGRRVIDPAFVPRLVERVTADDDLEPTSRELEVLRRVAEGDAVDAVARSLKISPRTVHKHLENLHRKLGAANRAELVSLAFRRGYVS